MTRKTTRTKAKRKPRINAKTLRQVKKARMRKPKTAGATSVGKRAAAAKRATAAKRSSISNQRAASKRSAAPKTRKRTSENNRSRESSFVGPTSPDVGPAPHGGHSEPARGVPDPVHAKGNPAHAEGHKKLHHRWRPSAEDHIQDKAMNAKQRFSPADKVRVNRSMQRRIMPGR